LPRSAPAATNEGEAAAVGTPTWWDPDCTWTRRASPPTRHPRVSSSPAASAAPPPVAVRPNKSSTGRPSYGSDWPGTWRRCR